MAGVGEKELRRLNGWPAGIDNLSPESDLTRDEDGNTIALREAENVDLRRGKPARRGGYAAMLAGTRVHSLWREGAWPFALYVDNGTLRGYRGGAAAFDIQTGLDAGAPVSYALAGSRVFWTNGRQRGCVDVDGTAVPWGCECPSGQPRLAAAADVGALGAGRYQVAVTFRLAGGEESGSARAATVDVPDGGGIALTDIPQPRDATVAVVRVYVSAANGEMLHQALDLLPGVTTAVLGHGQRGRALDTLLMTPLPAGRFVRLHAGRLFVLSAGGVLTWSQALRFGLTRAETDHMRLSAGTLLEAVGQGTSGAGLYVADAKRTYFLSGTPEQMRPQIVYPQAAVAGTGVMVPGNMFGLESADSVAYWMAADGVGILGLPGGQVVPVRAAQAVAPSAATGASLYRADNGMRQIVTALAGGAARGVAMRDRTVVTVTRHDTP